MSYIYRPPALTLRKPLLHERVRLNPAHPLNRGMHALFLFNISDAVYDLNRQYSGSFLGNTAYTFDSIGSCLYFDGTGDSVTFGDVLDIGTNHFTNVVRIKKNSEATSRVYISKTFKFSGSYRWNYYISTSGYMSFFGHGGTGADKEFSGTKNVADGQWHTLTGVMNRAANVSLYVDGELDVESSISAWNGQDFQSTHPFRIGSSTASDDITVADSFFGYIGMVEIYLRILSPGEVMNSHLNPYGTPNNPRFFIEPRRTWFVPPVGGGTTYYQSLTASLTTISAGITKQTGKTFNAT